MSILRENIDQIIALLGITPYTAAKRRLPVRLDSAEEVFRFLSKRPPRSVREALNELTSLKKSAVELLRRIEEFDSHLSSPPLFPLVSLPDIEVLARLRRDIPLVVDAAQEAIDKIERHRPHGRGGARHVGNPALEELIETLIDIYEKATGPPATVTKNEARGTVGGTSVQYLTLCLNLLGVQKTTASLGNYVLRHKINQSLNSD